MPSFEDYGGFTVDMLRVKIDTLRNAIEDAIEEDIQELEMMGLTCTAFSREVVDGKRVITWRCSAPMGHRTLHDFDYADPWEDEFLDETDPDYDDGYNGYKVPYESYAESYDGYQDPLPFDSYITTDTKITFTWSEA